MRQTSLPFFVLFVSLLVACASPQQKTDDSLPAGSKIWAAFDIGSGATKMKVGRIGTADQGGHVEILFPTPAESGEVKVAYQDAIKASGEKKELSEAVIERGITEIQRFKKLAEGLGATEFIGVATAAFREATNGKVAIEKLAKETGMPLRIISQEEEASLGFWAAVGAAKTDPSKTISWDIGGGSQQISFLDANGAVVGSNNNFGSDILKEKIRQILKRRKGRSINPVGKAGTKAALAAVKKEAKKVSHLALDRIADSETRVIGIGSVHSISIKEQAMAPQDKSYDQGMVKKALEASWDLKDDSFNGRYIENQVPNLILVLGFMDQLEITEVTPFRVNLADGLLRTSTTVKLKAPAAPLVQPASKTN